VQKICPGWQLYVRVDVVTIAASYRLKSLLLTDLSVVLWDPAMRKQAAFNISLQQHSLCTTRRSGPTPPVQNLLHPPLRVSPMSQHHFQAQVFDLKPAGSVAGLNDSYGFFIIDTG